MVSEVPTIDTHQRISIEPENLREIKNEIKRDIRKELEEVIRREVEEQIRKEVGEIRRTFDDRIKDESDNSGLLADNSQYLDYSPEDKNHVSDPTFKTHEIRMIIPSTSYMSVKGSVEVLEARRDLVIAFLVGWFGGATSTNPTLGAYKGNDGSVITEQVLSVTSFCTAAEFHRSSPAIIQKAEDFCTKWGQECIGLELDGVLRYISPNHHADHAPTRNVSFIATGGRASLIEMYDRNYSGRLSLKKMNLQSCNQHTIHE